jgi:hypothetical protein
LLLLLLLFLSLLMMVMMVVLSASIFLERHPSFLCVHRQSTTHIQQYIYGSDLAVAYRLSATRT